MNYANQIKNHYWKTKIARDEHRKKLGFVYAISLEDKLKDSYDAYKEFCYKLGIEPKKIIYFLKTEII